MLILGFNTFLPPGWPPPLSPPLPRPTLCASAPLSSRACIRRYKIEFSDDQDKPRVQLKYPQGHAGPQPQPQPYVPPPASAIPVQQPPPSLPGMAPSPYGGQPLASGPPEISSAPPAIPPMQGGSSAVRAPR